MNTSGMKAIGKGTFSTVWLKNKNTVLIKSNDSVKECMSLGWMPDSSMLPKVEAIGTSDCGQFKFYEEKYYPKVKSLKNTLCAFDWEFYKALRDLEIGYIDNDHDRLDILRDAFNTLPAKFNHRKHVLLETLDALSNYGCDIGFEISPRNVATQGKKLILLDCFFMVYELKRANKEMEKKRQYRY